MPGDAPPQTGHREKVVPFGRIPYALVDSGLWATLKPADHAVYAVIAAHAGENWESYPSLDRIADLAGVTRSTVCVAIRRLEEAGIIQVAHGGGRGNPNAYLLVTNGLRPRTVFKSKTVCAGRDKQSAPTAETVCAERRNSLRRPDGNRRGTERTDNTTPGDAADGVRDELARHGITDPKLSELASLPGLTARIVRDLAARIGKAKNPGGLLVALVEREGPQLVEAARSKGAARERQQATARQDREAEAAARAEQEAEQARRLAVVNGLSDAELTRRTDAALAAAALFHANRWRKLVDDVGAREAIKANWVLCKKVCEHVLASEAPSETAGVA